jgi:hypothetical protein
MISLERRRMTIFERREMKSAEKALEELRNFESRRMESIERRRILSSERKKMKGLEKRRILSSERREMESFERRRMECEIILWLDTKRSVSYSKR